MISGRRAFAVLGTAGLLAGISLVVLPAMASADEAVVVKVIDGDTVDVTLDGRPERVRLLNIDAPETKHPDRAVECLGPEAADRLRSLLPVGARVRLEYDQERTDRYNRTLAAVFSQDGTLINAELARAGLARAVTYGPNDRFRPEVEAAQTEAAHGGRGLYSEAVECTPAGQVAAVSEAITQAPSPEEQPPSTTAAALETEAAQTAAAVATAAALQADLARGPRGVVWEALTPDYRSRLVERLAAALAMGRDKEMRWTVAVEVARTKEAEAARIAAERQARLAAEAEAARVEAQRRQQEQESARAAASVTRQPSPRTRVSTTQRPKSTTSPRKKARTAAPNNPYPGYTGPRCYAPGGKSWKPCP
jgi:micrococcal nuclease